MDDSMSSWLTNAYVCVRAHDDEPLPRLQLHEHQGDLDEADGGHRAQHIDHWKFPLVGKLRCIVIEEFHQPLGGRVPLGLQELDHAGLARPHDEQPEQDAEVHGLDPRLLHGGHELRVVRLGRTHPEIGHAHLVVHGHVLRTFIRIVKLGDEGGHAVEVRGILDPS